MMLFNMNSAWVSYCLVDTPIETPDGDHMLNRWDDRSLHRFEGRVDAQKRVTTSEVMVRDLSIEQKMLKRYEIANTYFQNYLAELYYK